MTGEQIDDFLEARAASVETSMSGDFGSASMNCLKEDFDDEDVIVNLDTGTYFSLDKTGALIWEQRFLHFLTDVIYYRFAIGSPTVDPETGNVLCVTSAGLLCSFTPDGQLRWQHATMSEFGRLIFPNGRTGSVIVDGELAIIHMTTSGWGPQGPARERFFAFDKDTGECVWTSTPGGRKRVAIVPSSFKL